MKCPKCGKPVPPAAALGRPSIYCSQTCRRLAEFEISRLNKRLERLEDQLLQLSMAGAETRDGYGRRKPEQIAILQTAIVEQEHRLQLLLSGT